MNIDEYGLLKISASQLIGQSIAILGIKGSGKSNTAAVLMEEFLAAGVPICVVDIAGEYHTLKDDHKIFVVGESIETAVDVEIKDEMRAKKVANRAYSSGTSIIFDVSGMPQVNREPILHAWFLEIWKLSAIARIPLMIFLEEAHNWVPQRGKSPLNTLMIDVAAEGRKRGLSLVLVGQRSARIDKDTLTQSDTAFLHKVRHPSDLRVYTDMIPRDRSWIRSRINKLKVGEALVLVNDRIIHAKIRERQTRHVGNTPSLDNIPSNQLSLFDLKES